MPTDSQKLNDVIQLFAGQDPELQRELEEKIPQPSQETINSLALELTASESLPPISEPGSSELAERAGLETIVRPLARPVLTIRDNQTTLGFLGPDSEVWRSRIASAASVLNKVIPSIGRVEVNNNPDFTWLG